MKGMGKGTRKDLSQGKAGGKPLNDFGYAESGSGQGGENVERGQANDGGEGDPENRLEWSSPELGSEGEAAQGHSKNEKACQGESKEF